MTTSRSDTKSNPNPKPTAKQHEIVSTQLNTDTCPTYHMKRCGCTVFTTFRCYCTSAFSALLLMKVVLSHDVETAEINRNHCNANAYIYNMGVRVAV